MFQSGRYPVVLVLLAACLPSRGDSDGDVTDSDSGAPMPSESRCPGYAPGWTSIHADCYNSDYGEHDPAEGLVEQWVGIPDSASIVGATVDEARGQIYVTRGQKDAPNLVVYSRDGEELWDSSVWAEQVGDSLDMCAVTSAPIVDENGNMFVGGCLSMWASDPDGTVLWRTPMPHDFETDLPWPFLTAFFTRSGEVGGVTADGMVVVFDAADGALLDTVRIPKAPESESPVKDELLAEFADECLWKDAEGNDLVARDMVGWIAQGFFGVGLTVGNSPATLADPDDDSVTRIFVPGVTDLDGDETLDVELYRIDFDADTRRLTVVDAFDGVVLDANGSATSPNLSADGSIIMMADNNGLTHGFSTDTGAEVWPALDAGKILGSATTDLGEDVLYVGNTDGELRGYQLGDGAPELIFERSFVGEFEDRIDEIGFDNVFARRAVLSGVITKTPNRFIVPFTIGYDVVDSDLAVWPVKSFAAIVDGEGNIVEETADLRDVIEAGSMVLEGGQVLISHTSISSSIFHCIWRNRQDGEEIGDGSWDALPEPLRPQGGLTVLGN